MTVCLQTRPAQRFYGAPPSFSTLLLEDRTLVPALQPWLSLSFMAWVLPLVHSSNKATNRS